MQNISYRELEGPSIEHRYVLGLKFDINRMALLPSVDPYDHEFKIVPGKGDAVMKVQDGIWTIENILSAAECSEYIAFIEKNPL